METAAFSRLASLCALAWALATTGCGGDAFQATDGGSGGGSDTGAGGDASVSPEGGASSWCAQQTALFCDDFDSYGSFGDVVGPMRWSTYESNKGAFALDSKNAFSRPNALQAAGNNGAQVLLVKTFPAPAHAPAHMRLEFDLRINDPGTSGYLDAAGFAAIAFGDTVNDGYAAVAIAHGPALAAAWALSTDAGASDAGTFQSAAATGSFPSTRQWIGRYALQIDLTGSPTGGACIQVFQGPQPLLSPCLPMPSELVRTGAVSIAVGDEAAGFGNTGPVDLEFDNVTFDMK